MFEITTGDFIMDVNPNLNRINNTTQLVSAASSGAAPVKLPFTEVIKAAFSATVEKIPRRYKVILLVATAVLLVSIMKLWHSSRQKTIDISPKAIPPVAPKPSDPLPPPAASPAPIRPTLPPATSFEPTPHVPLTATTPPSAQTMSPYSAATSPRVNEKEKNEKKRDEPDDLPPTIHLPLSPCGSSASASDQKAKIVSQRPAGLKFTNGTTKQVIEHIEGYPFANSIKEENRNYPDVIPQMSPDELAYMHKLLIIRRAESFISTKSWSMFREDGDQQAFDQNSEELKGLFQPHFATTCYYHIVRLSRQQGDLDKLGMTDAAIKDMLWKRLGHLPPEELHQHDDFLESLGKHLSVGEWKPIVLKKTAPMSITAIARDMRSFIETGILVPGDSRKEQQTLQEEAIVEVSGYQTVEQLRVNVPTFTITDRVRIDHPTKKCKPILFEKGFLSPNTPAIVRLVTKFVRDNSRSYIAPPARDPFARQTAFAATAGYITFCELMPLAIPPLLDNAKKDYKPAYKALQEAQASATTKRDAALATSNVQNAEKQLAAFQTAYDSNAADIKKIEDYLKWNWDSEKRDLQTAAGKLKDGTPEYERACDGVSAMYPKKAELENRSAKLKQANADLLTKYINPWTTHLSELKAAIELTLRNEKAAAQATFEQTFDAIDLQFKKAL